MFMQRTHPDSHMQNVQMSIEWVQRRLSHFSFKSFFPGREGTEEVNKENGKQIDSRGRKKGKGEMRVERK